MEVRNQMPVDELELSLGRMPGIVGHKSTNHLLDAVRPVAILKHRFEIVNMDGAFKNGAQNGD